jgi:hypothetical protein
VLRSGLSKSSITTKLPRDRLRGISVVLLPAGRPGFLEANLRTGLAGAHCPEMAGFFPCGPSTVHNAA